MDYNEILFDLIKKHKWDDIIDIIKNKEFDPNIRDKQNNYLLTYLINFNKPDIIDLLIKKGARTTITIDDDNKNIIYNAIKFNYIEIIDILLKNDNLNIGPSIINCRDNNEHIPLHYAIILKNIEVIDKLIKAGSDVSVYNKNGNNSLHLAVFSKDEDICKRILKEKININFKNNNGQSALHLACSLSLLSIAELLLKHGININEQDYLHDFTVLHYSVNLDNIKITKLILNYNPNINIQDIYGNTPLHYSIINSNINNINLLIETMIDKINFNLWNISSKTPLHLIFEKKLYDTINKKVIEKSNLNIQDEYGNSCLHYICEYGLWTEYKDILKHKRLDIFVRNKNKVRPIDFINKNDIDKFIDIIAYSYINILRTKDAIWNNDWENICKKNVSINELKMEKDISEVKKSKDICKDLIVIRLKKSYKNKQYEFSSFPIKKGSVCLKVLDQNKQVKLCTFTGTTFDILIGLIYLLEKYNTIACSTLTSNFMINNDLCNFYKTIGIITDMKCEFLNFEIVWTHKKLYTSTDFDSRFKKCTKRFIIMPLGIEMKEGSHANYIIYDRKLNEIERFEPHGNKTPIGLNYDSNLLDLNLKTKFSSLDVKKYISPKEYLPTISFQMFDVYESTAFIGDPSGFCALWAIWYVDMRLKYPNIDRKKLVNKLIKEIKKQNILFRNLIRNYSNDLIIIRDNILASGNIDINDWLNNNYTDEQFSFIVNAIKIRLTKVL